ncbi:MAG: hypothetical protein VB071_13880 [Lawsonibacter sp.]|nr:hypothetical protein [Lawsonibacter sp.]
MKKSNRLLTLFLAGFIFCLCQMGAALSYIHAEATRPFFLMVEAGDKNKIQRQTVDEVLSLDSVEDAFLVLPVTATLKHGATEQSVTLYGMSCEHVPVTPFDGSAYMNDGSMPKIMLSQAVIKDLSETAEQSGLKVPDWLKCEYKLEVSAEDRTVTRVARVCGVFQSNGTSLPDGFISMEQAQKLLLSAGLPVEYSMQVQLDCIGSVQSVSERLINLGLTPVSVDTEEKSNMTSLPREIAYLSVIAIMCLLFIQKMENCRLNDILLGTPVGIISAMLSQYLFPPQDRGAAMFALPIPLWAIGFSLMVAVFICLFKKKLRQQLHALIMV